MEDLDLYWGPPEPLAFALDANAREEARLAKAYYDAVWPLCRALVSGGGFRLDKMLYTHLSDLCIQPGAIGLKPPRQWAMNAGCTAYCRWPECSSQLYLTSERRRGRRRMGRSTGGAAAVCSKRPVAPTGVVLLG